MPIKSVTAQEIRRLEKRAIEKFGIPSIVLMENAGRRLSEEIIRALTTKGKKNPRASILIFCGPGNNGGDGYAAARYLINAGFKPKILSLNSPTFKSDAAVNFQILKNLRYPIKTLNDVSPSLLRNIAKADIVIDAIFGVGLNRFIAEPFKSVILAINKQARTIIAADIPSGLDATTGKIYGVCVKAMATVTFSFPKKGFFRNEGPVYAGKIIVADVGIPIKESYAV